MRKYGVGEILLEEDDLKRTASQEDKAKSLAEVREEQQRAAEEQG